jgi:hypothetical protein
VRQLIKRILREETRKDLSPIIKELLNTSIGPKYKRIICTFDAIPPWKTLTNSEDYQIMVSVIGGPGSKRWPNTQDKVRERDAIVNDVWHTVYNFIGLSTDVFLRNVKSCDEVMSELNKQEDNEGAGAYDAPAFEMEPDHTTFKHEQKEAELTERCWKGYTQKGMKTMFGKRYPNCVKKTK